jgi:hypothetical protein
MHFDSSTAGISEQLTKKGTHWKIRSVTVSGNKSTYCRLQDFCRIIGVSCRFGRLEYWQLYTFWTSWQEGKICKMIPVSFTPQPLHPLGRSPGNLQVAACERLRAGLGFVEKRIYLTVLAVERGPSRAGCSQSLYRQRYGGGQSRICSDIEHIPFVLGL